MIQQGGQVRIKRNGGLLKLFAVSNTHPASGCGCLCMLQDRDNGSFACPVVGVTYIEGSGYFSGDDVSSAWGGLYFADSRDETVLRGGMVFDCNDPLCCCGHRVVPQVHRRGAGVVALSGEDEFHAGLSDECLDDSKRGIFAFKHWALFDMKLKIGEDFVGQDSGGKLRGIETVGLNRLSDADAASIGMRKCTCVEFSDESEAAEEGLAEAHPLFL